MDKPSTLAERLAAQRGEVYRSPRGRTLAERLEQARETAGAVSVAGTAPATSSSEGVGC